MPFLECLESYSPAAGTKRVKVRRQICKGGFCAVAVLAASIFTGPASAAGDPYTGSAKALALSPAEAGFASIVSVNSRPRAAGILPGLRSSWTTVYARPAASPNAGTAMINILVYKGEKAAAAQYKAMCLTPDCSHRIDPNGWRYKRQTTREKATVVGLCRNLVVGMSIVGGSILEAREALDLIFTAAFGNCRPQGPAAGRSAYWTEDQAETFVLARVRVTDCQIFPESSNCRRFGSWPVSDADCRGADELGMTFRYRRFTCEILVRDGNGRPLARGDIAVWPTGPTTARWSLL